MVESRTDTLTIPPPLHTTEEWRLEGTDVDMDKLDVKALTRAISSRTWIAPSCIEAWRQRIGELPSDIGSRYNNALLTPRDWASHFKNVLHRGMRVKGHDPGSQACRCCKHAFENLQHLSTCEIAGNIFREFARMVAVEEKSDRLRYDELSLRERERFALFAAVPSGPPLQSGWINLHLLLWKHLVHLLTKVETEDAKFSEHEVWQAAWHRLERKALAKQESTKTIILRADSRGDEPPDLERKSAPLAPMASFDEFGSLVWDDEFHRKIQSLATPPHKRT